MGGLEGIEKRVGSRGKKKKENESNRKRKKPIQRSGWALVQKYILVKNIKALLGYCVYGEIFQSRWILPFWSMSAISVVVYQETL